MEALNILLIEDNEGDILLTTEALHDHKIINRVTVIKDGKEAIDFFETTNTLTEIPYVILLDINIPKVSGIEILSFIKNSAKYRGIPVIMLTTSSSPMDKQRCAENKVNSYMIKPLDVPDFISVISKIEPFGFNIVAMQN